MFVSGRVGTGTNFNLIPLSRQDPVAAYLQLLNDTQGHGASTGDKMIIQLAR